MNSKNQNIDHLFRHQFGRMVSSLVARFGIDKLDLIENAVMDSFYKAIKTWAYNGEPQVPAAWLTKVATNALLDSLKNKNHKNTALSESALNTATNAFQQYANEIIQDDQLRMIFYCCHPALKPVDQIAFTLKTISGFGNNEIANALLISIETLKKRLSRARKALRGLPIGQNNLTKAMLIRRIDRVHQSIYLLFNEGYYSSHRDHMIRKELCVEAMRLSKMICEHEIANSDSLALMALMCFHSSRFDSRIDDQGTVVLIKDQERTKWNKFLMNKGHHYLHRSSLASNDYSIYQLEAMISAQHCTALTFESTNWDMLTRLYKLLYKLKPQNAVLLNKILVHAYNGDLQKAQILYNEIEKRDLNHLAQYYAVGAQLYEFLREERIAATHWKLAAECAKTTREAIFYLSKSQNQPA